MRHGRPCWGPRSPYRPHGQTHHEIRTDCSKFAVPASHSLLLYRRSALLTNLVATHKTNAFRFAVLGVMSSCRAPGCICSEARVDGRRAAQRRNKHGQVSTDQARTELQETSDHLPRAPKNCCDCGGSSTPVCLVDPEINPSRTGLNRLSRFFGCYTVKMLQIRTKKN